MGEPKPIQLGEPRFKINDQTSELTLIDRRGRVRRGNYIRRGDRWNRLHRARIICVGRKGNCQSQANPNCPFPGLGIL